MTKTEKAPASRTVNQANKSSTANVIEALVYKLLSLALLLLTLSFALWVLSIALTSQVMAQTVLQPAGEPAKPGEAGFGTPWVGETQAPAGSPPPTPLPQSVAEDAIKHRAGEFPELRRREVGALPVEGGMIQEAWNESPETAGVVRFTVCANCVYKLRTRELMVTTLILPEDTQIERADIGDPAGFEVEARAANILAIRPASFGIDTNLNVYTNKGVFSFYMRAEGFNSNHVPDLLVRITDTSVAIEPPTPETSDTAPDERQETPVPSGAAARIETETEADAESILDDFTPRYEANDFVERVEFDPGKLHGFDDYRLWGDGELAPERVFRDEFFTYIQFGDRWNAVELPVAFVVIDSIDEQVNTRVQGRTYIVESTSPLITLKSGTKYICVEYGGDEV